MLPHGGELLHIERASRSYVRQVPRCPNRSLYAVLWAFFAKLGLSFFLSCLSGPKMTPRCPKKAARWPQDGPKMATGSPRWLQNVRRWPKIAPSWHQQGPIWPQRIQYGLIMAPRWPQNSPMMVQHGPKWHRNGANVARNIAAQKKGLSQATSQIGGGGGDPRRDCQ